MRNPVAEEINGISAYNVILTLESERMATHLIDGLNSVIGITATYHPIEIKVVGYDIDARIRFMVHNGVPCIKIGKPHGISYEETIGIFGLLMEKLSSNYTVERKNDSTAIVIECGESVLSEDGLRQLGQRIAEHIKNMFGDYAFDLLKRYIEPHRRGLLSMFETNDALTLYDAITMDPVYYANYKSDYTGPSLYLVRSIANRMLV